MPLILSVVGGWMYIYPCAHVKSPARKDQTSSILVLSAIYLLLRQEVRAVQTNVAYKR